MKLFVGSKRGNIFEYALDPAKLRSGSFNLIDSDFLKHDVGDKATISIADINNDGKYEYLIGNSRGGLLMYSDSLWDSSTLSNFNCPTLDINHEMKNNNGLKIYPNPADEYLVCTTENLEFLNPVIEIFNVLSEKMNVHAKLNGNKITIRTNEFSTGFYIVRISNGEKTYIGKILIER